MQTSLWQPQNSWFGNMELWGLCRGTLKALEGSLRMKQQHYTSSAYLTFGHICQLCFWLPLEDASKFPIRKGTNGWFLILNALSRQELFANSTKSETKRSKYTNRRSLRLKLTLQTRKVTDGGRFSTYMLYCSSAKLHFHNLKCYHYFLLWETRICTFTLSPDNYRWSASVKGNPLSG